MKQSQLFTKTQKFAPKDEQAKNAQLLIRAGYVHKEMAGVYSFLPLGWRVMGKIMNIIREEMNAIGGQEMQMSALQDPTVWKQTRWDSADVDVWFKTALQSGSEVGLGFTHEEPLTRIAKNYVSSYRDLPFYPYQLQNKFRNEVRAKSGIMRGREFIMKDLYSFSQSQEQHDAFYELSQKAYKAVFDRLGIGEQTFMTFASGGSFAKYSHEFQTICDAGEDVIYIDDEQGIAINQEVYNDEVLADLGCDRTKMREVKAAEVGNIFSLGTKFSDALDLTFTNESGVQEKVIMGSYGIGPGRAMGVITELLGDEKGLVWPEEVAPFRVHLIDLQQSEKAQEIYTALIEKGIDVLWDDRDARPGEKFADSDLIGIPWRVVVSQKSLDAGGVEVKRRTEDDVEVMSKEEFFAQLT